MTLEQTLGYHFQNRNLLDDALTHVSANTKSKVRNYQRLEFLGDHILGAVLSDMLYLAFPEADEGELSRRYTALARAETCTMVAKQMQIQNYVRVGTKEKVNGTRFDNLLADVCEAIIAAVYLDGGYGEARKIIEKFWVSKLHEKHADLRDAKSTLQEWAQGRDLHLPHYEIISRSGPDHAPVFIIGVNVQGFEVAMGEGASKRIAEQNAAQNFLARLGLGENQ